MKHKKQIHLVLVAALIVRHGKVLLAQRLAGDVFGLKWEFPGGGVEPGETFEAAITREIAEELGVLVTVEELVNTFFDQIDNFSVTVHLFRCRENKGEFKTIECNDFRFVTLAAAKKYDLAPVDKKIVDYLKNRSTKNEAKCIFG